MNRSSNYSNNANRNVSNVSNAGASYCNGTKYVIKKGDTLYSISRRYDVPLAMVLRANPYVDVYNLQIGDEICIPDGSESQTPAKSLGPVRLPVAERPAPVNQTRPQVPVRPPKPQEPDPVITRKADRAPMANKSTESGTRNTFNFNYYGGNSLNMGSKNESVSRKPAEQVKKAAPVRQTIPVVESKPVRQTMAAAQREPARQAVPARRPVTTEREERDIPGYYMDTTSERPVRTMRKTMPVRIITAPVMEEEMYVERKEDMGGRWCSNQDRERFHSILNYDESMEKACCTKMPKCTQSVTRPEKNTCGCGQDKDDDDNGGIAIISYVSKDNDTLQDVLDYFTMDVMDLFQYNVPDRIHLKPGCMIRVPGKGDDR
ncbi:LysM peptidoglycan-binding domain-containing protein [[Clostridium] polysaccharolyticum]|uniref:LysM domain-containing protein n=1 Tax=[Clostridium] polysaccharolyticum TaxID=29364 RepID=A0A1I0BES7_9FIRM|nr:LysM peptidoglycan-binding domain-containing protein [[Clostridium] polysaccharolyticum]SET05373.1 LysM domain-containing protein [[Clostridium] polysaccharolyticum]